MLYVYNNFFVKEGHGSNKQGSIIVQIVIQNSADVGMFLS